MIHKDYLGDSVYAEFDGYGVTLTTDNGMGASNTIYLEPEVFSALQRFVIRVADPASPISRKSNEA